MTRCKVGFGEVVLEMRAAETGGCDGLLECRKSRSVDFGLLQVAFCY